MEAVSPSPHKDGARFVALLAHFARVEGITKLIDFATRAGISEAMVSKMKKGERRAGRDVQETMQKRLGLDPNYWSSDEPYEPALFMVGATAATKAPTTNHRLRALDLAVKLGVSDAVVVAVLRARPPTAAQEQDPFWWAETIARSVIDSTKVPSMRTTTDPTPNRTIVMQSPEYRGASDEVRAQFQSIDVAEDMSVVGWSTELRRLIDWREGEPPASVRPLAHVGGRRKAKTLQRGKD